MNYAVLVFDESNTLVAKMENATTPSYSRSKNAADQINFSVPRTDDKISELKMGRRFEIVRSGGSSSEDSVFEASGYISELGYSDESYEVNGFTEEIVLSRYLTPSQYGYALSTGSGFANLSEWLPITRRRFNVIRAKALWADYVQSQLRVDYTTEPRIVLLDGYDDPSPPDPENIRTVYPADGYIIFRFTKNANEEWERIRWVSDNNVEAQITTTIQYREGDAGAYSDPVAGALTDTVGIDIPQDDADSLWVRVDFATEGADSDASPVLYSLEVITSQAMEEIDSINYSAVDAATVTIPNLEADNKSMLDVIIDVCEETGWEFKLERRVLYFAESLGASRLNDYTLVES